MEVIWSNIPLKTQLMALFKLVQFINTSFTKMGSKQDMVPQMSLHKSQAEGCKYFPT